jgi:PPM family protein phosphatase
VNSFINRFFRKKTSRDISPSIKDPGSTDLQNITIEPVTASEEKILNLMQIKAHLDLPQLIVGVAQSVGIQRDHNEDALYTLTTNMVTGDQSLQFGLYIVADGMGGHENGEIASSVAVDRLTSHVIRSLYLPLLSPLHNKLDISIQEIMQTGVIQAHQTIKKEVYGSGTTLTSALILGDQMTIAHVGDSRAYMFNPDRNLQLLTHDHSLVKRLEEIGQILPEQASTHPQRNVLYRALGQGEPFEPDITTIQIQQGTQLLICTDGLWGVISDNEIEDIIRSSPEPQQACQSLINLANSAGGPDNISVIIVQLPK